jgi:hypothetical protein
MAVVQNANEEHQFLFAVNTISMVKSDALFSYIPPTNVLGWLLIPFKYCIPFKRFVRLNRLIIKITHIPILFTIFLYERLLLSNLSYGPTDLVEHRGRSASKAPAPAFSVRGAMDVFSPGHRLREPSITTFRKDRALDEVFRRPFRDPSFQTPSNQMGRRNSSNVVSDWMNRMGSEGGDAAPPQEDTQSTLDRLELRKRPALRRNKTAGQAQSKRKHPLTAARAVASDPEDLPSPFTHPIPEEDEADMGSDGPQQTEDDGDDELLSNDDDDHATSDRTTKDTAGRQISNPRPADYETSEDEFFRTPMTIQPRNSLSRTPARSASSAGSQPGHEISPSKRNSRYKPGHNRNLSTNTVLFSPTKEAHDESYTSRSPDKIPPRTATRSGTTTPGRLDGLRTPKRPPIVGAATTRPRAIMPPGQSSRQTPRVADFVSLNQRQRDPSFNAMALDLASDLGDNRPQNFGGFNGLPASFSTQIEMAARARRGNQGSGDEESKRMSRIMLARMTTLEEGFRDVLKEVKGLKTDGAPSSSPPSELARRRNKGKKKSTTSKKSDAELRIGSSV